MGVPVSGPATLDALRVVVGDFSLEEIAIFLLILKERRIEKRLRVQVAPKPSVLGKKPGTGPLGVANT